MLRKPQRLTVQSGCRGDNSRVGINRKLPPSLSKRLNVTVLVVASESLDDAVIPTTVPMVTFSSTAFDAPFTSVGAVTANSLASTMAIEKT